MNLQQHIDSILSQSVFSGEFYYIMHPDAAGSPTQVAQLYGVYAIVGGEDFSNLEGDIDLSRPRVQISVYAVDSAALVTARDAVAAAMKAANVLAVGTDAIPPADPETTAAAMLNYSASVPVDGYEVETGRFYSHCDYYCSGA
jgi:hypothetical protein